MASHLGSPRQGLALPSAQDRGAHGAGSTRRRGGTNGCGSTSARTELGLLRRVLALYSPSAQRASQECAASSLLIAAQAPSMLAMVLPNTMDMPQVYLQDVPAINHSVADSQGLCECFFLIPQPLCHRWHPFCAEPGGRAQERTQLPLGCCTGETAGVPKGHRAPLPFMQLD